ncbi:MAG TPA: glycosyltransferase family 4 protein, partial [Thermoanaerobaculia bacterium]|nr:glycosyltransferase family 4 protein [Thermoanaerobaculia bacterium]
MRIAVVEPVGRGGLVHYAFELCQGLAEEGAEVVLITDRTYELGELSAPFRVERLLRLWDARPAGEGEAGGGTAARSAVVRRALRRLGRGVRWHRERLRLLRRLRRLRPDVVQLGDLRFAGDLPFLLALRASGLRLADVCHNVHRFSPHGGFGAGRLARPLFRRMYRQLDAVFVHWEVNRRRFLDTYGPIPGRLRAIAMGSPTLFRGLRDPAVTAETLRARLGLPAAGEARVVLAFGTLAPYKGLDVLVEAFAHLPPRGATHVEVPPPRGATHVEVPGRDRDKSLEANDLEVPPPGATHLVVAGFPLPGFDPEGLRRQARRLGVADRVRVVPGYVPSAEVAAWMELADVAAFPHREVFQSGVLQVAAAFGVPVVASLVGATSEVIRDGETGLLVPPGNAAALAAALDRLLSDPAFARRLGAEASEDSRTRLAWRRAALEILD